MNLFRPALPAALRPATDVLQAEIQHQTNAINRMEAGEDTADRVLGKVKARQKVISSCNDLLDVLGLPAVRMYLAERRRAQLLEKKNPQPPAQLTLPGAGNASSCEEPIP
jgi:hypothetical protein